VNARAIGSSSENEPTAAWFLPLRPEEEGGGSRSKERRSSPNPFLGQFKKPSSQNEQRWIGAASMGQAAIPGPSKVPPAERRVFGAEPPVIEIARPFFHKAWQKRDRR